jgi:hypothetical protein
MIILIVGVVGGAGTTTLAHEILHHGDRAVPLDLADGTLGARTGRRLYPLDAAAFSRRRPQTVIEEIIDRQTPLLWTANCHTAPERVWALVRSVAQRLPIVADGGLNPPAPIWELATVTLAVNRAPDDAVTRWHEQRLRQEHRGLRVVTGDLRAAGVALAGELLPRPERHGLTLPTWLGTR